jgi:SAM-dependent methyltransferase
MKKFRDFIKKELNESIGVETKSRTKFLVQSVYTHYADHYNKNQPEVVGWMDGSENALIRNTKLYEAGIKNEDSVLDVGCGVAHFYYFLENKGWKGKYLGVDPNEKAIKLIEDKIPSFCGTIDDIVGHSYDWVLASGVFNLGLKEQHTKWTIKNMIKVAKKGVIFNMLAAPYKDDNYASYVPEEIKKWLEKFDHRKINIMENYMDDNAEFTVYFYV